MISIGNHVINYYRQATRDQHRQSRDTLPSRGLCLLSAIAQTARAVVAHVDFSDLSC